jgi:hypothetical protein
MNIDTASDDRRQQAHLRRLVLTGNLMAERLEQMGDGDGISGVWGMALRDLRDSTGSRYAEGVGTCELCGRADHHLIDAACPSCRERFHLEPAHDYATVGAEADVRHAFEGC